MGDTKDFKRLYWHYSKKCERLEKKIKEMEEEREGWMQVLQANNAIIAGIVEGAGGELTVPQEAIKDVRQEKLVLESRYDETTRTHTLGVKRPGE